MKLIHSNYEILEQGKGLDGINEQIELAGRACYKSEPKYMYYYTQNIDGLLLKTDVNPLFDGESAVKHAEEEFLKGNKAYTRKNVSAEDFVDRMIHSGHGAMLEHGTVYLICPIEEDASIFNRYYKNKYSICKNYMFNGKDSTFITTNLRVLVDNGWLGDLKYLSEPIPNGHEKRITVKFTCDRGVSHEFVRHRVFSFAQESTRYCNYSKDKFSNEITYICPCWLDYDKVQKLTEIANKDNKEVYRMGHDESLSMEERGLCSFVYDMSNHEHGYLFQISTGWKAQEARAVLPNSLKTELVMTGFASDWEGFFKLRDNSKAHPDAQALAKPLHEEFIKKGYIDGNLD